MNDQPAPTTNGHPFVQDVVLNELRAYVIPQLKHRARLIVDIEERKAIGIERYGTPLQPFNGRDPLVDCYQELIDAAQYAKQRELEAGTCLMRTTWRERHKAIMVMCDEVAGELEEAEACGIQR